MNMTKSGNLNKTMKYIFFIFTLTFLTSPLFAISKFTLTDDLTQIKLCPGLNTMRRAKVNFQFMTLCN